jgi:hypothetical protein
VLQALVEERVIKEASLPVLYGLRTAKSAYRSSSESGSKDVVAQVAESLSWLPRGAFPKKSIAVDAAAMLRLSTPLAAGSSAYRRLRNLERCYLSLLAAVPSRANSKRLDKVARWIRNPRAYVSIAASVEGELIETMQMSWRERGHAVGTWGNVKNDVDAESDLIEAS